MQDLVTILVLVAFGAFIYKDLKDTINLLEERNKKLVDEKGMPPSRGVIVCLIKVKIYKDSEGKVIKEEYFDVNDNSTETYEYFYNSNGIKVETKWFRWWIDEEDGKKHGQRTESRYDDKEKIETEIEYEDLEGDEIRFKTITYYNNRGQEEKEDVYNSEKIRHTNRYKYDQLGRIQSQETELYYTTDEVTGKDIHKLEATADQKPKARIERWIFEHEGESELPVKKSVIYEYPYNTIHCSYDEQDRKISEMDDDRSEWTFYYYEGDNDVPYLELSGKNQTPTKIMIREMKMLDTRQSHTVIAENETNQTPVGEPDYPPDPFSNKFPF